MKRRKVLLGLAAVWSAVAFAAVSAGIGAGTAQAWSESYCGEPLPPHTSSEGYCGLNYIVHYNIATYQGSGTVGVCEKSRFPPGNGVVSRRCGTTQIDSNHDLDPYCSALQRTTNYVGNDSAWTHTIRGTVEGGNGAPC